MANNYTTLNDLFTAIANAIRAKNNSTNVIVADNFPAEIDNIVTGFDYYNYNASSISNYAFYNSTDLKSVNVLTLENIGDSAFEGCSNLETIFLYNSVSSIGENAFKGCSNLTIYCEAESKPDGWHENWNPDNCNVVWGETLVVETWDISGDENSSVIAKLYNLNNDGYYILLIMGYGNMINYGSNEITSKTPWSDYSIKSAIINNSILNIGSRAFHDEDIENVVIGTSVTSIGFRAFSYCDSLTSITIPDSVISIGGVAFENSNLTSITIPDSVTSIGDSAFFQCNSLKEVHITDITAWCNIDFTGSRSNPLYHAKNLYLNGDLVTNLVIPNGVTEIKNYTFYNCESLTSITIPDSVTSIGDYAFTGCYDLEDITYTGSVLEWNNITLSNTWSPSAANYTIHCTDGDIAKDGTITYK